MYINLVVFILDNTPISGMDGAVDPSNGLSPHLPCLMNHLYKADHYLYQGEKYHGKKALQSALV